MARGRILVVEHDSDALRLMTDTLRQGGYVVICAMDGAQALELANMELVPAFLQAGRFHR